jgi:hypothetical protein
MVLCLRIVSSHLLGDSEGNHKNPDNIGLIYGINQLNQTINFSTETIIILDILLLCVFVFNCIGILYYVFLLDLFHILWCQSLLGFTECK